MAAFNNMTDKILVKGIQKGNMELFEFMNEKVPAKYETLVWYNNFIWDEVLRMQVPLISYTTTDKNGKNILLYYSDFHEYDGFNGLENAQGKFRVCYVNENCGFDEYKTVDFESIEELMLQLY